MVQAAVESTVHRAHLGCDMSSRKSSAGSAHIHGVRDSKEQTRTCGSLLHQSAGIHPCSLLLSMHAGLLLEDASLSPQGPTTSSGASHLTRERISGRLHKPDRVTLHPTLRSAYLRVCASLQQRGCNCHVRVAHGHVQRCVPCTEASFRACASLTTQRHTTWRRMSPKNSRA